MSTGHVVCIVTSMVCNDIPFVVIRLATMIIFGFLISDMVFLVKNIFVIIFNIIQLSVIFYNRSRGFDSPDGIPENRCFRGDEQIWGKIGEMISANQVAAAATGANNNIDTTSSNANEAFAVEDL